MRRAWGETPTISARSSSSPGSPTSSSTPTPAPPARSREGMDETLTVIRLGISRQAPTHVGINEPMRVDDRHRPHHPAQRQTLVLRGDGSAVDRRRDARSRETVPQGHRLLPTSRASLSRSNHDFTFPSPTPSRPRSPRSQSLCNHHTGTVVTEVPRRPGQPRRAEAAHAWIWAKGAALNSAVGAVRRQLWDQPRRTRGLLLRPGR